VVGGRKEETGHLGSGVGSVRRWEHPAHLWEEEESVGEEQEERVENGSVDDQLPGTGAGRKTFMKERQLTKFKQIMYLVNNFYSLTNQTNPNSCQ